MYRNKMFDNAFFLNFQQYHSLHTVYYACSQCLWTLVFFFTMVSHVNFEKRRLLVFDTSWISILQCIHLLPRSQGIEILMRIKINVNCFSLHPQIFIKISKRIILMSAYILYAFQIEHFIWFVCMLAMTTEFYFAIQQN